MHHLWLHLWHGLWHYMWLCLGSVHYLCPLLFSLFHTSSFCPLIRETYLQKALLYISVTVSLCQYLVLCFGVCLWLWQCIVSCGALKHQCTASSVTQSRHGMHLLQVGISALQNWGLLVSEIQFAPLNFMWGFMKLLA